MKDDDEPTLFDLTEAKAERDKAVAKVHGGADPEWLVVAARAVDVVAGTHDEFTADDVWQKLDGWGVERPREQRALAPVLLAAKRAGQISPTSEFRSSARRSRHAAPLRVWESHVSR